MERWCKRLIPTSLLTTGKEPCDCLDPMRDCQLEYIQYGPNYGKLIQEEKVTFKSKNSVKQILQEMLTITKQTTHRPYTTIQQLRQLILQALRESD